MEGIFVSGTDTGVGKTIITALLAKYLRGNGLDVITQKWVQTGCPDLASTDIRLHFKIMGGGGKDLKNYLNHISPYIFKTACSPHLSCLIENKRINPDKIIKSYRILSKKFNLVIVEGTGGVLVPLNKRDLLIDIAKKLGLSVLIVAQNKLGTINHTLLTIEALRRRRIKILGIVFNNPENESKIVLKDNPLIIKALSKEKVFGVLPRINKLDELYQGFIPIGKRICKAILRTSGLGKI